MSEDQDNIKEKEENTPQIQSSPPSMPFDDSDGPETEEEDQKMLDEANQLIRQQSKKKKQETRGLNAEQLKCLARRKQMQREGRGKTLREAMASAGSSLTLQDDLMAEKGNARQKSSGQQTSEDSGRRLRKEQIGGGSEQE